MIFVFFCNIIKVNHFLHCFIILLHLVFSFLHIQFLHVPYTYVSTESIDCILLSSLTFNAILLTSSVKTLSSCVFNINLLFFMNSLSFSHRLSVPTFFFVGGGGGGGRDLFYFQIELLLNGFHNL